VCVLGYSSQYRRRSPWQAPGASEWNLSDVRAASLLADNANGFLAVALKHVAASTGLTIDFVNPPQPFEVDLGFIPALAYVLQADAPQPRYDQLAAPVLRFPRGNSRPEYFADVVVRADSPYRTLDDLRGTVFTCNSTDSNSGYNLLRQHLALQGNFRGFFREVIFSGAHLDSLRLVRDGEAQCAAVDCTVLAFESALSLSDLRVVASLGPSPAPPAVLARGNYLFEEIQQALFTLSCDGWPIERFAAVTDADYDAVRRTAHAAATVRLGD